jgi:hypothetical protein
MLMIHQLKTISRLPTSLNHYFLNVANTHMEVGNKGKNQPSTNPINYLSKHFNKPFPMIQWHYVSTHEIKNIIKSLKSKNTYGYDKLSNKLIKLILPYITSPLVYICNAVLKSGIFPDRLKYAIVKPIYKKGSKTDMSNYRPISILTSF